MRRLWVLTALLPLLCLAQTARADLAPTTGINLGAAPGVGLVYMRSISHDGMDGEALRLGFPVYDNYVFGKQYELSADILGFLNQPAIGIGASASLKENFGSILLGAGFPGCGYDLAVYVGFAIKLGG